MADDAVLLKKLRATRAALANAVGEVARLGGCIDPECEFEDCWLGVMPESEGRRATESAIAFIEEVHQSDADQQLALVPYSDEPSRSAGTDGAHGVER